MSVKVTNTVGTSLRDKAKEIDAEIEGHLNAIKRLEADRNEISSAEKTLLRLGIIQTVDVTPQSVGSGHVKKTVPDMILDVLKHDYPDGSEPHAVLTMIRRKFDPDADPNNVRPTLWRMAKDGRLEKSGELYRLPRKNEAAAKPSGDETAASGAYERRF